MFFSFLIVKQIVSTARRKKKAYRLHFSFKSRSNIFKEMISWIANIKELVDFETLDAFKRIGRPRPFFYCNDFI